MKSLSEIVGIFILGMLLKCLSDIIGAYPNMAQQMVLWISYVLLAISAALLAINRWAEWRHRRASGPEVHHED